MSEEVVIRLRELASLVSAGRPLPARDDGGSERVETPEEPYGWSILGSMIAREYREGGFVGAIIYGRQGAGKSVYAIKTAADALARLGKLYWEPVEEAYRQVWMHYMVFSSYQLVDLLDRVSPGSRLPVVIWDDAGVFGSAYFSRGRPMMAKAIGDLYRVVRTRASSMLMTTPSPQDLLKPLRSYETLYVWIKKGRGSLSEARIYKVTPTPSGNRVWVRLLGREHFIRRLPGYGEYEKFRDKYAKYALDQIRRMIVVDFYTRLSQTYQLAAKIAKLQREMGMDADPQRILEDMKLFMGGGSGGHPGEVERRIVERMARSLGMSGEDLARLAEEASKRYGVDGEEDEEW